MHMCSSDYNLPEIDVPHNIVQFNLIFHLLYFIRSLIHIIHYKKNYLLLAFNTNLHYIKQCLHYRTITNVESVDISEDIPMYPLNRKGETLHVILQYQCFAIL